MTGPVSTEAALVADIEVRALAENQAFEVEAQASNDDVSPELADRMPKTLPPSVPGCLRVRAAAPGRGGG